ncbi:MAG: radical SAM protein [Bacteroidales bacterium]|nr:radical SAM protein [Bacteroidales bacterium]
MRVFGPVPSRRLGRSIGINNIPPKICSLSCVYCQIGRSLKMISDRQEFYLPADLVAEVKEKIKSTKDRGDPIDYLTIVPDGEPTLDKNLGQLIIGLKPLNIKIAVITNSTLIYNPYVRKELAEADWVSIKIDAANETVWRKIDRPHRNIDFNSVLSGIRSFAREYRGILATETMLVKGVNDNIDSLEPIADIIKSISPTVSYISIPTRPPAEKWVEPPAEKEINMAYQIFAERAVNCEYLIGYEGNKFAFTGDPENDILSITAVHPMREDAVTELLNKSGSDFSVIVKLIKENKIITSEYNGYKFFTRKLSLNKKL